MKDPKGFLVCLVTLSSLFGGCWAPTVPIRPNVVFILADDLGSNDVGCYGSAFHETPNIDALAKRGMRFNQAYAASPLCSPTRASILTGMHPARIGITAAVGHSPRSVLEKRLVSRALPDQKMLGAESITRLKQEYYTIAEALKSAGYATAHFGKWHLGPEPYSPLQHGFDVDVPHTAAPSPPLGGYIHPFAIWKEHGKPGDHLEDLVAEQAVEFIEQHRSKPFFLNYWAFEVHSPWQAKRHQIQKYRAKASPESLQRNPVYAGMVETLDDVVGRLVGALETAGVLDNTVIIFTSDNGPYVFPNHPYMPVELRSIPPTSASPLRAGKATIYEGGMRVPLLIAWPGVTQADSESEVLVQSTDFFPTIAERLGLKLPANLEFDGVSFASALNGGGGGRDEVFCHVPHPVVSRPYDGILVETPEGAASSLRKGDWKLVRIYGDRVDRSVRHELYDLKNDPSELHDLANARSEKIRELSTRLDQYLQQTAAVVPEQNPDYVPSPSKALREN